MTYEELNTWFIEYIRTERNNIVTHGGIHSSRERELQNILSAYAAHTGQDIETLNETTDKNKFYAVGQVI
jgi:low affinity Fe/Cu permease